MSRESCAFCRIVDGHGDATVVYRDERVVAFRDTHPVAPVHILIVPAKHIASLHEVQAADEALLTRLLVVARKVALQEGLEAEGYRLVLNAGTDGGQTVFHLHLHVMGGRRMHWPPG